MIAGLIGICVLTGIVCLVKAKRKKVSKERVIIPIVLALSEDLGCDVADIRITSIRKITE